MRALGITFVSVSLLAVAACNGGEVNREESTFWDGEGSSIAGSGGAPQTSAAGAGGNPAGASGQSASGNGGHAAGGGIGGASGTGGSIAGAGGSTAGSAGVGGSIAGAGGSTAGSAGVGGSPAGSGGSAGVGGSIAGSAGSAGVGGSIAGSGGVGGSAGATSGGGGAGGASTDIVCRVVTPLPSGVCAVTPGDASKLITGTVLTPEAIYRGGQVLIDATGLIACVGCDCTATAATATTITCPSGVVSPGLINTMDHLTYDGGAPFTDTGERYESRQQWRTVAPDGHTKLTLPGGASLDQMTFAEIRFLLGGATSTVSAGAAPGVLRNLDKVTEELGLAKAAVVFAAFPLNDSSGPVIAFDPQAPSCGYVGEETASAIATDDAYLFESAEGINAGAENELFCAGPANPTHDLLGSQSACINGVALTAASYADLAATGTALVWSPRSNVSLYGDTARITVAAHSGVEISLGTDWLYTGSMNLLRALRCADALSSTYFGGVFSDRDLWMMVTANAADVAGDADVIGSLASGKVGDVAIFDGAAHPDYRAIIDGEVTDVALVLRGGKVLYGDAAVVTAVPDAGTCEDITLCGATTKKVCVQDDIGKSFATLQASVGGPYGVAFCGVPTNEPTCKPTRPVSVSGSTIYTGDIDVTDADGDGIADASDDCPAIFDPIRPMDGGVQSDADGDGRGDACDPCPLDPDAACVTPNLDDPDGDGLPNAGDNCPDVANGDQLDADADGKGDACDVCPGDANPGLAACPD